MSMEKIDYLVEQIASLVSTLPKPTQITSNIFTC